MSENNEIQDLGDDLQLTRTEARDQFGGTWVNGTIAGHRFQALVFAEHATNPEYEIEDSRISKLWIQRQADEKTVFNWDRGMDLPAATPAAQAIVDFLAAGLAESIYGG